VEKLNKMLTALNIRMRPADLELTGKELLRVTMSNWLPIHRALLDVVCLNLPSPASAQQYRSELLYSGPADDACGAGMRACDPQAPLLLYISRLVPSADKGRFIAWGRVLSGCMHARARVRIMGPNFRHGASQDLQVKIVPRVVLLVGRRQEPAEAVPAGNVCGLIGVDQFIVKRATLADSEVPPRRAPSSENVTRCILAECRISWSVDTPRGGVDCRGTRCVRLVRGEGRDVSV